MGTEAVGWVTLALALLLVAGVLENVIHSARLRKIPVRILVNGSRGKSTVVRLTAAALRHAGYRVVARTTGTAAMHIYEDGTEAPIGRRGGPRILELRETVRLAAQRGANGLVVECMALRPELQRVVERRLVRSTHGVITNVREDHRDVMGATLDEVARSLAETIPAGGTLVTGEGAQAHLFQARAAARQTRVVFATPAPGRALPSGAAGTDLSEFPENEALVLSLCAELRVPGAVARAGMAAASRDPGAAALYSVPVGERGVLAVDAFAANDPTSTGMILDRCARAGVALAGAVALFNHRPDRVHRALEFIPFLEDSLTRYRLGRIVVIGKPSGPIVRRLRRRGVPATAYSATTHSARCGRKRPGRRHLEPEELMAQLFPPGSAGATVVGVGNSAGVARELVAYWARVGAAHV